MCIAILSPKGTQLSKETLNICWLNNYNGAGFAYNDDSGKLHTVKEMENFDKFYDKYEAIRTKFPNSTMLIHFRISTHGVINRTNCHPFKVNKDLAFIHNGVIRDVEDDKKYSDTNMFNRTILRMLPGLNISMLTSKGMKKLMGEFIGYSKLVFMDSDNNYAIINEQKGHWGEDGIWYSNDSYKKVKDTIDFGGRSVSRSQLSGGLNSGSYGGSYGGSYYGGSYGSSGSSLGYKSSRGTQSSLPFNGEDEKIYKTADGTETCSCRGIHFLEGEITSMFGECLECVTADEADEITSDVINDNYTITVLQGTPVVDQKKLPESPTTDPYDFSETVGSSKDKKTYKECHYCTSVLESDQVKFFKEHDAHLCKGCVTAMVDHGYLTEDKLEVFKDKENLSA